jgi:hypothetical protein
VQLERCQLGRMRGHGTNNAKPQNR